MRKNQRVVSAHRRRGTTASIADALQHEIQVLEYLIVPETDHAVSV
jgi:hypothetical protein